MKSEFGKGLAYCLGLFLAHEKQYMELKEVQAISKSAWDFASEIWFNSASDHLYDLQIDFAPKNLRKRLRNFQAKCLHFGHGFSTSPIAREKDVLWAINEAKDLLMLIDKANKIPTEKGRFR